jgi:small subunit ribosomal protein S4
MARNRKPQGKITRRLGIAVTDKQQRILSRRGMPPGQHGPKGYPRISEYGKQLQEKQKAKFIYGLLEKQFRNYFKKAVQKDGDTGENLFRMLELRLDNVLFRTGIAKTRQQARQMVSHAHVRVNDGRVNIPSYQVKVGDSISIREKSAKMKMFDEARESLKNAEGISWATIDGSTLIVKITDLPKAADMTGDFNPKSIIEFYSR